MDAVNRVLLDRLQRSFPIVSEPYQVLSGGLEIDEREVRKRIESLKEQGSIRQISAIFNTGALGYQSSLVAMAVPEGEVKRAYQAINRYPGVSHNYLRPGPYNMWYTVAVPAGESVENMVRRLTKLAGEWPTLVLPALRKYKLAVVLDVLEEGEGDSAQGSGDIPSTRNSGLFESTPDNIRVVQCIQEDLPSERKPFGVWANALHMKEKDLLELISKWIHQGIIRRFAAVLNHRQVGFSANGMVVWQCPEDRIDEYGNILASCPEVSHCYHRLSYPEWPYNLYAMIHGRSVEACRNIAEQLGRAIQLPDYRIFFSEKEFKKIRLKLFWEDLEKTR